LTVVGKGDKERRIPFSIELRRILFRYGQARERIGVPGDLMFPSDRGSEWNQRNALRSFYLFQRRLGVTRVGFHRLRHTFATEYLRNGGDVVRLSRTLGHSQITTTMRYVQMLTADLQRAHGRCSPLTRIRN
jgi:integrase/recombinase XerD